MAKTVSNKAKHEILDWVEEMAEGYQNQYGGCGQTVVLVLQRKLDLPGGPAALKAAGFFGLGIARMGDVCGALIGSIQALGLASGRENVKDPPYPEPEVVDETTGLPRSLVLIRRFYQRFVQEFGSSVCRDIQIKMHGRSYDLGNTEEFKEFHRLSQERCAEMVGKVTRLAAETILEMPRR